MKNLRIALFLLACMALVLVGCHNSPDKPTQKPNEDMPDTSPNFIMPSYSTISVYSLSELEEMREMISCTDTEKLEKYLQDVSGADSRQDLEEFVKLVDSIPHISIVKGDIVWISHSCGSSMGTGNPFSILTVSTEAENGEWTRIEYNLLATKSLGTITNKIEQLHSSELLTKPIQSKDKKATVYAEIFKTYISGAAVIWTADIDGVLANIYYHPNDIKAVDVNSTFSSSVITDIKSLCVQ